MSKPTPADGTWASFLAWFMPPRLACDSGPTRRDYAHTGVLILSVMAIKWLGAILLLAPYDLNASAWRFGFEVGHIANNLAAGHGFSITVGEGEHIPSAWLSPAYPLFLALIFRLTGAFTPVSADLVVASNCLFQSLTAGLLYLIGLRLAGRWIALVAVVLFTANPGGWQFLDWAWPTQLLAVTIVLHIALLFFARSATRPVAASIGASLGLALLVDGAAITLVPVAVLVTILGARRGGAVRVGAPALLALILVLLPWAARNYAAFGVVNPLRGNLGVNLWVGNHPGARAESFHGMSQSPWHTHSERRMLIELGELAYDRHSRNRALGQILAEPLRFASDSWRRFSAFWLAEWWTGFGHIPWGYSVGHVALSMLAIGGAFCGRRLGIGFIVMALLLFALPYSLTVHGHGRYRVPVEPLMCLLAAFNGLPLLLRNRKSDDGRS